MVVSATINTSPLVSVIIPCYNQAAYLTDSVNSVLAQTYTNWECIIVNDGSTDNTGNVAKSLCANDGRFKYVEKMNGGLSSARNAGLKNATGNYIQLLDADDIILPGKLKEQVDGIIASGATVSICDYKKVNRLTGEENTGGYAPPFIKHNLLHEVISCWESHELSIPCHCVVFSRQLVTATDIVFNENLPNHEDWVFWVEIFNSNPPFVQVKKILCIYYITHQSMSSNKLLMRDGFKMAGQYLIHKVGNETTTPLLKARMKQINRGYAKYKPVNIAKKNIVRKLKYLRVKLTNVLKKR